MTEHYREDRKSFTARMPVKLLERLDNQTGGERRYWRNESRNYWIEKAITEFLDRKEAEEPKGKKK